MDGGAFETSTVTYRSVGGIDLRAHVFTPRRRHRHTAVVFFHGGGLTTGSPEQFFPECEHLAGRGALTATVAYRLLPAQARQVSDCIADAQAAVAWLRGRVDGARVAACGFSAGGLLAGATALGSCPPDAVILLNAVIGDRWFDVDRPMPPTLLLHGRRDSMAPLSRARRFAAAMTAAGHACELVEFDGAHTFFRPIGRNGIDGFIGALGRIDAFLTGLGFLPEDRTAGAQIEARGAAILDQVLARRAKRRPPSP